VRQRRTIVHRNLILVLIIALTCLGPIVAHAEPAAQQVPDGAVLTADDLGPGFEMIGDSTTAFGNATVYYVLYGRDPAQPGASGPAMPQQSDQSLRASPRKVYGSIHAMPRDELRRRLLAIPEFFYFADELIDESLVRGILRPAPGSAADPPPRRSGEASPAG